MQQDQKPQPGVYRQSAANLAEQASRCRRLARGIEDRATAEILERMAREYDDQARRMGA